MHGVPDMEHIFPLEWELTVLYLLIIKMSPIKNNYYYFTTGAKQALAKTWTPLAEVVYSFFSQIYLNYYKEILI